MDVGCTLNLGYITDLGCGLLHPHRALSLVAELFVIISTSVKEVIFSPVNPSICLFVDEQHYAKSFQAIFIKKIPQ